MNPPKDTEIIKTKHYIMWLHNNGILYLIDQPNLEDKLHIAKEKMANVKKLGDGKKIPVLCDITKTKYQDKDVRDYYAGEETAKVTAACALIIDSSISNIIGNFFMGINKPKTPTRLFTAEEEAVKWLKSFV